MSVEELVEKATDFAAKIYAKNFVSLHELGVGTEYAHVAALELCGAAYTTYLKEASREFEVMAKVPLTVQ